MPSADAGCLDEHSADFQKVCAAIDSGSSVLVLAELGMVGDMPQHLVMPIVVACLMVFGVVQFIGMGTRNKSLYIFGGTALVAGMTMKQLGQVRGARKRLGQ